MGLLEWLGFKQSEPQRQAHRIWPDVPGPADLGSFFAGAWSEWSGASAALVAIEYVDFNGSASRRKVAVQELTIEEGRYYLIGHCFSRREKRQFRIDRMRYMVNVVTGEIIEEPIAYFHELLAPHVDAERERLRQEEEKREEARRHYYAARDYLRDEIYVLVHLARSEGDMPEAEGAVIRDYLTSRLPAYGLTLSAERHEQFLDWALSMTPSRRVALEAISRVEETPARLAQLGRAIAGVVKAREPATPAKLETVAAILGRVQRRRARREGAKRRTDH